MTLSLWILAAAENGSHLEWAGALLSVVVSVLTVAGVIGYGAMWRAKVDAQLQRADERIAELRQRADALETKANGFATLATEVSGLRKDLKQFEETFSRALEPLIRLRRRDLDGESEHG